MLLFWLPSYLFFLYGTILVSGAERYLLMAPSAPAAGTFCCPLRSPLVRMCRHLNSNSHLPHCKKITLHCYGVVFHMFWFETRTMCQKHIHVLFWIHYLIIHNDTSYNFITNPSFHLLFIQKIDAAFTSIPLYLLIKIPKLSTLVSTEDTRRTQIPTNVGAYLIRLDLSLIFLWLVAQRQNCCSRRGEIQQ